MPTCDCGSCRANRANADEDLDEDYPEQEDDYEQEEDDDRGLDPTCDFSQRLDTSRAEKGRRLIGVEWEFNRPHHTAAVDALNRWAQNWNARIIEDGSCGFEAVTPPVAGSEAQSCLTELGKALKDCTIDNSCGLHVHVDARDLQWPEMIRLLRLYARVEPLLYAIAGQKRVSSTYAAPIGERLTRHFEAFGYSKEAVLRAVFGGRPTQVARHVSKKHGGRYRGINIIPWISQRRAKRPDATVEFRIHRDTDLSARVIGWAFLCEALVSWANKATDKELESLPRSPLKTIAIVAPNSVPWILNRLRAWRKDVRPRGRTIRVQADAWRIAS